MWYELLLVSERRRYPRKKTLNLVFYNDRGIGRTRDLSVKGALIETEKKPPSSMYLDLAIGVKVLCIDRKGSLGAKSKYKQVAFWN